MTTSQRTHTLRKHNPTNSSDVDRLQSFIEVELGVRTSEHSSTTLEQLPDPSPKEFVVGRHDLFAWLAAMCVCVRARDECPSQGQWSSSTTCASSPSLAPTRSSLFTTVTVTTFALPTPPLLLLPAASRCCCAFLSCQMSVMRDQVQQSMEQAGGLTKLHSKRLAVQLLGPLAPRMSVTLSQLLEDQAAPGVLAHVQRELRKAGPDGTRRIG
jgi:hypothetical protein